MLYEVITQDIQNSFLLIDTVDVKNKGFKDALNDIVNYNLFQARGIIQVEYNKLMYVPSPIVLNFPKIKLHRDAVPDNLDSISLNVENEYFESYKTVITSYSIHYTKLYERPPHVGSPRPVSPAGHAATRGTSRPTSRHTGPGTAPPRRGCR